MISSSRFSLRTAGFVAVALFGSGAVATAAPAGAPQRGEVTVRGPSVRAVAAGPIAIHAYSEFRGGSIYTAPAITGTDRDCQIAAGGAKSVPADHIAVTSARQGQVICLATDTKGSFELLWHAVGESPRAELIALQSSK